MPTPTVTGRHIEITRRAFLGRSGVGVGSAALATLLPPIASAADAPRIAGAVPDLGVVEPRHWAPRAKRVIFLCMAGGPSHLETFDYKPALDRMAGQRMPESYTSGMPIAQLQGAELRIGGHLTRFTKHGASGQLFSGFLPHMSRVADDVAIVKSMITEQINHDPAHTFLNCGSAIAGRPSMGSWVVYGLGSQTQNLPGFVVLVSASGPNPQPIAARQWSAGFLPGRYQGVEFNGLGDRVHYLSNPPGYDDTRQRGIVDAVNALNRHQHNALGNPETLTRIAQYELAFRMQMAVPESVDLSDEPEHIRRMYGVKEPGDGSFASNCLLARRLAERGVRFIQLYHRGWDHHENLKILMERTCAVTDQPTAALIQDLKQRGMLDDTLVIWGGEFGRTPMAQGSGRDHHIKGFSMVLAGGGVRGGVSHGATDEFGYAAVDAPVHIRDLHATMLYLLGIDHNRFSVKHDGLDVRLAGVKPARIAFPILV